MITPGAESVGDSEVGEGDGGRGGEGSVSWFSDLGPLLVHWMGAVWSGEADSELEPSDVALAIVVSSAGEFGADVVGDGSD